MQDDKKTILERVRQSLNLKNMLAIGAFTLLTEACTSPSTSTSKEKIEAVKNMEIKNFDTFSKLPDMPIEQFEEALTLAGYSIKDAHAENRHFAHVYCDIFDKTGQNVGAYSVVRNNETKKNLMMGNIEVDSRDTQLKKVLQDIGCNKGNPINYKCDSKKSIGENMFYQDQEREILFQKSAELQKSGKSTR